MLGRGTSWSTSSGVGKYLVCQRSSKGTTVVGREGGVGETGRRGGERGPDRLSPGGIGRA